MKNITANELRVQIGTTSYPKNTFLVNLNDEETGVYLTTLEGRHLAFVSPDTHHLEGAVTDAAGLYEFLDSNSFKRGGTDPGEVTGVQSVSGSLVTGTPEHPTVNIPTWEQIPDIPESFTPSDHTHVVSDITDLNIDQSPTGSTIVERTATGQGKFAPAIGSDEAVVKSQLDSSMTGFTSELENKVDKEAGKGLSSEDYTTDEKSKLAGLEDVHYKGWFTSLTSLELAHPAPEKGSHALVDDVAGSLVYIWKTDVEPPKWEAKVGESTEITAAQVKTYYESNPDTNAFTDARRDKLDSITSIFTSALKTAYDNAVNWISTNGQLLINHLSNTSNPHNVTAEQIGLGNIDLSKVSPLISSTVQDGVTINEYEDRIEYLIKIQAPNQNIGTGGGRYDSHTSTVRLPDGVSVSGADWAEISIKNSNRALDICVYDNSSRYIVLGYFNNYNDSASVVANPTVFIKLTNYK